MEPINRESLADAPLCGLYDSPEIPCAPWRGELSAGAESKPAGSQPSVSAAAGYISPQCHSGARWSLRGELVSGRPFI